MHYDIKEILEDYDYLELGDFHTEPMSSDLGDDAKNTVFPIEGEKDVDYKLCVNRASSNKTGRSDYEIALFHRQTYDLDSSTTPWRKDTLTTEKSVTAGYAKNVIRRILSGKTPVKEI